MLCKAPVSEGGYLTRDRKEVGEGALKISREYGFRESQDQVQRSVVGMYLLYSWNKKESSVPGVE